MAEAPFLLRTLLPLPLCRSCMQLPIGPFALDLYDLDIQRRKLGYQVTSITRIHKDDSAVVNDF